MISTKDRTNVNYLRALIKGIYDIQQLRIQTGNRITINIKSKLGLSSSAKESTLDIEAAKYLILVRSHYKLLTKGLIEMPTKRKFKADGVFNDFIELTLASMYTHLYDQEEHQIKILKSIVNEYAIWQNFMKDVLGVGPMMAAVMISELDIEKAKYPSCFQSYAGLDVVAGVGRSRIADHLVDVTYTDKKKQVKTRKSITFNPFLKTKLIGVLGPSFIKQSAAKCKYRKIYDDYKFRLQNMPAHKDKSDGHRHSMAVRYMIKIWLIDLHVAWATVEGQPVYPSYAESKLGYTHGMLPKAA